MMAQVLIVGLNSIVDSVVVVISTVTAIDSNNAIQKLMLCSRDHSLYKTIFGGSSLVGCV